MSNSESNRSDRSQSLMSSEIGNQTVVLICNMPGSYQSGVSLLSNEGQIPSAKKKTREEREAERQKQLVARTQAKEKKAQEKLAKKLEREKKEEERRLKREKEEEEKRQRKEKREAERIRKLEENAEKMEIKRKKEMEKREKEVIETEKKKREQSRFRGFFVPNGGLEDSQKNVEKEGVLPILTMPSKEFEVLLQDQSYVSSYLSLCKQNSRSGCRGYKRNRPLFKLLQFSENNRPPYWGTWRKRSQVIRPRAPFDRDEKELDYAVDSDDEWEEEEPGESLSDSEVEDEGASNSNDEDEDNDGFFVPHGYLSEGEGDVSDEECEDNRQRKRLARVNAWDAEYSKKHKRLAPFFVSLINGISSTSSFPIDRAEQLLEKHSAVLLSTVPIAVESLYDREKEGTPQSNKCPVPETAMPELIRLVHKNSAGLKKLTETFLRYWCKKLQDDPKKQLLNETTNHQSSISKRQLEMKILAIATKPSVPGVAKLWRVHENILKQYGLSEDALTPLCIEASPDVASSKQKTPQQQLGMKTIKHFFTSPASITKKGVVRRSLPISNTPVKKRRVSLEPVIIDCDGGKENTPDIKCETTQVLQEGINWQQQLKERNKISVSIDIHI